MNRFLTKSLILFLFLAPLSGAAFLGPELDAISWLGATAGTMNLIPRAGLGQNLSGPPELRQYTAGGHVLVFREDGVVIASGSHALRVEFVNAHAVTPVEEGTSSASAKDQGGAPGLGKVTYRDLWDGVSIVYEKTQSAVVKSTYYIQPGGAKASNPVDEIRLGYNVPVKADGSGNLVLSFATGEIQETRPVAWQEVAGKKVAVEAGYQLFDEREVGFKVGAYDPRYPLVIDPVLIWNTFLGATGTDRGSGIAVDTNGDIYVTGYSPATWGSPTRPYTGGDDAFVAKLDGNGVLQWNTFLGGTSADEGNGIAVDTNGNVYVTGASHATWGSPLNPYSGSRNVFVAKLDSIGALQWNTFMYFQDPSEDSLAFGIAVNTNGDVCVTGRSTFTLSLAFVALLDANGAGGGSTLGSNGSYGEGIAVDTNGNFYLTGSSAATWGSPVRPHTAGNYDAFVAKLDTNRVLQWNTFLGSYYVEYGNGIAVDTSGNIYVTGTGAGTWGSPVNPYAGSTNGFVAKLDNSGALIWNTFLGGPAGAGCQGIALDTSGNIYVTGPSSATWGSPVRPYTGGTDAFSARLNGNGVLQWNTFLGGAGGSDAGLGLALDTARNVYVTGMGDTTWGSPVRPYAGGYDAFVAKLDNGIRVDFNKDGQEDILWRYQAEGAYKGTNCVWLMNQTAGLGSIPVGTTQMEAGIAGMLKTAAPRLTYRTPMDAGNPRESTRSSLSPLRKRDIRILRHRTAKWSPMGINRVRTPPAERAKQAALLSIPTMKDAGTVSAAGDGRIGIASLAINGYLYPPTILDLGWEIVGAGDFNGDGNTDILWRNYGAGEYSGWNCIWYMNGATIIDYGYPEIVLDLDWRIAGTGDFDGDGHLDILWRNYGSGTYSGWNCVWYMDGTMINQHYGHYEEGIIDYGYPEIVLDLDWRIEATGDFNEDGHTDLLWRNYGSGTYSGWNCIWYMDGEVITGYGHGAVGIIDYGYPEIVLDLDWKIAGAGDFNGDGHTDLLWRNYGSGTYSGWNCIWYMDGTMINQHYGHNEEGIIGFAYPSTIPDTNWRIVNR